MTIEKVRRFNHEYHPNRMYNQSLMMPVADGQYIEASEVDGLVESLRNLVSAYEDLAIHCEEDPDSWPEVINARNVIARFAK